MDTDTKEEIIENIPLFLSIGFIIFFTLGPAILFRHIESQAFKRLNEQLSQVQSNIEIQSITVNLALPENSFVYDEQGGIMTDDSQILFNKESDSLSFKISYPNGIERDSKSIELYKEKNKNTYQIKSKEYNERVASVKLLISSLNTSLNWYQDQTRINPSENGELEVTLTPQFDFLGDVKFSATTTLIGYSPKDNSIQDGIILKYIP